ncbi:MAG TPA: nuclear transport factor 2 family protein [Kofleriaceae bacterium]|nr:nuclear transport factor 2 family protein [Kofleriaceae bacterium]
MSIHPLLAFLALGAACAGRPPTAAAPTPAPVVAAERAFAADGRALGIKASFLKHSSADAIIIQPDPVNAHASLSKEPDPEPGAKRPLLVWWPLWAGVARSGDLGFTTGPFTLDDRPIGHYFTVWRKQPDGTWKWVFDGGVDADPKGEPPPDSPAGYLPLASEGSSSPAAAMTEVKAAEASLARRAASDLSAAYLDQLADDARLHTAGRPPDRGRGSFAGALEARGPAGHFNHLGGGASLAGDLVWTYGDARWSAAGVETRGHYVRVWQKRARGWQLVFDQLLPYRGPPG